jgi:hypothetical protein
MENADLNSTIMIREQTASVQLNWHWPVAVVFARLCFAVIAQILIAVLFFDSAPSPYQVAGRWWPVYGILIDLGCFFLITWRASKEGLRFRDLIHFDPHRLGRDILLGFVYILWFFPLAIVGILGFSSLIYGTALGIQHIADLGFYLQPSGFSGHLGADGAMHSSRVRPASP